LTDPRDFCVFCPTRKGSIARFGCVEPKLSLGVLETVPDTRCICLRCGRLVSPGLSKPLDSQCRKHIQVRHRVWSSRSIYKRCGLAIPGMDWLGLPQTASYLGLDWHSRLRSPAARRPSVRRHPVPGSLLCRPDAEHRGWRASNIEVLGKFNSYDGDVFRAGDNARSNPPMPKIDRDDHRRAPTAG